MFEHLFRDTHTGRRLPIDHGTDRPLQCRIVSEPGSEEDEVFVHVEQIGPNARRGPCKWSPRPGNPEPIFPKPGDLAIMIMDSTGEPWILQWWPY